MYAAGPGPLRESCAAILRAVAEGRCDGRTSTAALEEVWHLERSGRAPGLAGAARATLQVFTPLIAVTDEIVRAALELEADALGSNDLVHAATCMVEDIGTVLTADRASTACPASCGSTRRMPMPWAG